MARTLAVALSVALAPACSGGSSSPDAGSADFARPKHPPDMYLLSQCGHYGDKGNSKGVGQFCLVASDCTPPSFCTRLKNGADPSPDDTYFCTISPCKADGGSSECGENATCECGSAGGQMGCGCTPNACLGSPGADGGNPDGK